METQQQSIIARKKWNIKRGRTASRKWELPENRSKTRKWGLPDPTAVFMATFRENAKVEHDHQTPETRESSVTKVMEDKVFYKIFSNLHI